MCADTMTRPQDRLLTVNTRQTEIVENVLPGVHLHPLFLDPDNGIWVLYARFDPGVELPRHFHTGTVHFYTTAGAWQYVEYPGDVQTAGSYLYEPGGSAHAFMVPADAPGPAEGFMVVSGANVNFDADGNFLNVQDAGWIEQAILAACAAAGRPVPRYIRPGAGAGFSDTQPEA